MAHAIEVELSAEELAEVARVASRLGESSAAWASRALRASLESAREARLAQQLEILREAAGVNGPTGDIEEILADIERGRQ